MNPKTARKLFNYLIALFYFVLVVLFGVAVYVSIITLPIGILFFLTSAASLLVVFGIVYTIQRFSKDKISISRNISIAFTIYLIFLALGRNQKVMWLILGPFPWTIRTVLAHLSIEPKKPNLEPSNLSSTSEHT
jgi:hypothetical protein